MEGQVALEKNSLNMEFLSVLSHSNACENIDSSNDRLTHRKHLIINKCCVFQAQNFCVISNIYYQMDYKTHQSSNLN